MSNTKLIDKIITQYSNVVDCGDSYSSIIKIIQSRGNNELRKMLTRIQISDSLLLVLPSYCCLLYWEGIFHERKFLGLNFFGEFRLKLNCIYLHDLRETRTSFDPSHKAIHTIFGA